MKSVKALVLFSLLACITSTANAARFTNPFIEFDTPSSWNCTQEQGEWICQTSETGRKRESIIVLAAKLRGTKDTIEEYQRYLDSPKTYPYAGHSVKSEKKYTKPENINGQTWIDSLHLESELPGYFTRYLATIKQDIGVLVTFSVTKDRYQDFLPDFEIMIKSIKVFKKTAETAAPQPKAFEAASIPAAVSNETIFPNITPQGGGSDRPKLLKAAKDNSELWLLGALALGLIFWLWKKYGNS